MKVGCELNSLPHCCGFMEAGYFREGDSGFRYLDVYDDTPEELIKKILDRCEGRPVIFNFVKECIREVDDWGDDGEPTGEYEDYYECESIRDAVRRHPRMIDLGKHINPGTSNKIHSLVIKDYL